ncbi:Leucine carboxyl methyltransferase 1 [Cyphellophora attinorum]|uniref:Leucine carboxyl methyltransferase 1 n=1 Tax=Cyphellophora attinorum TaxID=1664694 RepID=A0A0N0NMF1_9EURO|nr:Leucine carboxyl methyltransferase 1 [Phialophora attinorum]KPI40391.1 Leucine carboxyl methyltransferase 1 [Phialophora attinorum]
MTASSIPNLSTFRRGGSRLRGRGHGDNPSTPTTTTDHRIANPPHPSAIKDRIIRATDTDAATSRLSAVKAGYLDDPFAHHLYSHVSVDGKSPRRLPLMNRGTYTRTVAEANHQLGAGSDTRFFRLRRKYPGLDLMYYELDMLQNVQAKIRHLRSAAFAKAYEEHCHRKWEFTVSESAEGEATSLQANGYTLMAMNLRELVKATTSDDGPATTPPQTSTLQFDAAVPTLLLSEMALCYLTPSWTTQILNHFTHTLVPPPTPLSIVLYEPINPHTAFGRTMTSNLASRGISLPTLEAFVNGQEAVDLSWVWKNWVDEEEKERVGELEWMDEVEESELLGSHYALIWGWRSGRQVQGQSMWAELKTPEGGR